MWIGDNAPLTESRKREVPLSKTKCQGDLLGQYPRECFSLGVSWGVTSSSKEVEAGG